MNANFFLNKRQFWKISFLKFLTKVFLTFKNGKFSNIAIDSAPFRYRSSNFAIAKVVALNFLCFIFSISFRDWFMASFLLHVWSYRSSNNRDNYVGRNTKKKPWTDLLNIYKDWSKEIKSDNFCYRKIGRTITKWGAIEKSSILLSQYWENFHL